MIYTTNKMKKEDLKQVLSVLTDINNNTQLSDTELKKAIKTIKNLNEKPKANIRRGIYK
jgi:hypothetical protein